MLRSFIAPFVLAALAATALVACNGNDSTGNTDTQTVADADAPLPKPEPTSGSVTGMPDKPGPRVVGAPSDPGLDATLPSDEPDIAGNETDLEPGADGTVPVGVDASADTDTPGVSSPGEEPTPEDAVGVLRDYYAAIDAHNFAHAWGLWSDNGRSSGQTPQQFADGFANTAHVAVSTGAPGAVEAAAGSRYIQVPISIEAAQRDGSVRRYTGTYTLRRAVVDGATPGQRAWKLASATLHEVRQ
jgi:hypothetical protein